ncbi:MAG: hypothetical protein V3W28_04310 [Thermoplasmata archaeon]
MMDKKKFPDFIICKRCGQRELYFDSIEGYDFGCLGKIALEWERLTVEVERLRKARILKFKLPKDYLDEEPAE